MTKPTLFGGNFPDMIVNNSFVLFTTQNKQLSTRLVDNRRLIRIGHNFSLPTKLFIIIYQVVPLLIIYYLIHFLFLFALSFFTKSIYKGLRRPKWSPFKSERYNLMYYHSDNSNMDEMEQGHVRQPTSPTNCFMCKPIRPTPTRPTTHLSDKTHYSDNPLVRQVDENPLVRQVCVFVCPCVCVCVGGGVVFVYNCACVCGHDTFPVISLSLS